MWPGLAHIWVCDIECESDWQHANMTRTIRRNVCECVDRRGGGGLRRTMKTRRSSKGFSLVVEEVGVVEPKNCSTEIPLRHGGVWTAASWRQFIEGSNCQQDDVWRLHHRFGCHLSSHERVIKAGSSGSTSFIPCRRCDVIQLTWWCQNNRVTCWLGITRRYTRGDVFHLFSRQQGLTWKQQFSCTKDATRWCKSRARARHTREKGVVSSWMQVLRMKFARD